MICNDCGQLDGKHLHTCPVATFKGIDDVTREARRIMGKLKPPSPPIKRHGYLPEPNPDEDTLCGGTGIPAPLPIEEFQRERLEDLCPDCVDTWLALHHG